MLRASQVACYVMNLKLGGRAAWVYIESITLVAQACICPQLVAKTLNIGVSYYIANSCPEKHTKYPRYSQYS